MAIIPERIRNSRVYEIFQKVLRVLQFLSAIISLGLFSARIAKVLRLARRVNTASGAVEGILAAAVAYTILPMILNLCLKAGASKILRYIMIILDLAFVGAFIAVAVLTRPNGGSAGCPTSRTRPQFVNDEAENLGINCNLPLGTFGLAIVSTLLHAATAIFHEVKDHHQKHRNLRRGKEHRDEPSPTY